MLSKMGLSLFVIGVMCGSTWAWQTPQVREYEQDGIRYRETRSMVQRPIREVRYVDQQQTYYMQRYRTDLQQQPYTTLVPVTQYECVARLHDWWRIFREPYVAYHYEPYTTWQAQTQIVTVPVTRREVVPQTRTAKVAIPTLRFAAKEQVKTVALGTTDSYTPPPQLASREAPTALLPPPSSAPPQFQSPNLPERTAASRGYTYVPVSRPPAVASADPYNQYAFPPAVNVQPGNRTSQGIYMGTTLINNAFVPPPVATGAAYYGGIARLEGDPPRYGTRAASDSTWQARR